MLSSRLVRLIEEHWEPLTSRVLNRIRADVRLAHIGALPAAELRDRGREILEHLGHWLSATSEHELTRHFERLGGNRHHEGVPLDEVVLAYLIIKEAMIDFIRAQGMTQNSLEVYAEEELEHAVGHVFDSMVYHIVRGYTAAIEERHAHAAAHR